MGTVHTLARHETASLGMAIDAYLATLAGPESAGTRRVYTGILRQLQHALASRNAATETPSKEESPGEIVPKL